VTPRRTWWTLGAVIAGAVLTRFVDLGSRFFHHDEAIHAWFARELAVSGRYHADPVYHGPLLYHLEAVVFRLAGDGELQARLVTAAFGVLLVVLLYALVRREAGTRAGLAAAALALASPTLTYYSRFNSHDILIAVFSLVLISMPFEYRRTGRAGALTWFAAAAALAISTKLNAWFVLGALAAYGIGYRAWSTRQHGTAVGSMWRAAERRQLLIAGAVAASIVAALFATTLLFYLRADPGAPLRALLSTAASVFLSGFRYWIGAHETQRLGGPFHYYLPLLLIYETPVLVMSIGATLFHMRRRALFLLVLSGILLVELVVWVVAPIGLFEALRLARWQVMLATCILLAGGWTTVSLWSAGRDFLACWVFVGTTAMLLYSFAGEKVPWLTIHVMLPWLVVSAVSFQDMWDRAAHRPGVRMTGAVIAVALVCLSARTDWIVNTRNRSNPAEPIVQIEYTPDVQRTIDAAHTRALESDARVIVRIDSAVEWPFAWYLRHARPAYGGALTPEETAPMLLGPDPPADRALEARYDRTVLPLLHWTTWMANVNDGDIAGLLRFMLRHDQWGREGSRTFSVWSRKEPGDR